MTLRDGEGGVQKGPGRVPGGHAAPERDHDADPVRRLQILPARLAVVEIIQHLIDFYQSVVILRIYFLRGNVRMVQGNYEGAKEDFDKVVSMDPFAISQSPSWL